MVRTWSWMALLLVSPALAQQGPPPAEAPASEEADAPELERLRARMDRLERELEALKARLDEGASGWGDVEGELEALKARLDGGASGWGDVEDPFRLVQAGAQGSSSSVQVGPGGDVLKWLRSQQRADGGWATPGGRHDVAVTSMVLLAFLGNGHTHRFGTHKRAVSAGLEWLKQRFADGLCDVGPTAPLPGFDQAWGAMALAEAYAVSRDFMLKRVAEGSVRALIGLQTPAGGWSLGGPQAPANSLATVQAVLALKAALTASVLNDEVRAALGRVPAYLDTVTAADGLVGYRALGDGVSVTLGDPLQGPDAPLFTAGAILARVGCGQRRSEDAIRLGVRRLTWLSPGYEPLYAFLGTYASFQFGGPHWTVWNDTMLQVVLAGQQAGGEHAGAWEPAGIWGQLGGRVATTALNLLTLEIYFRYERATAEPQRR